MKFISWLLTLIILLAAVCFALKNGQSTTVNLWPFGIEVVAPLYILSLGTLFLGLVLGAVFGWAVHLPYRMEARRLRRDIANLHEKIEDMHATTGQSETSQAFLGRLRTKGRFWNRGS